MMMEEKRQAKRARDAAYRARKREERRATKEQLSQLQQEVAILRAKLSDKKEKSLYNSSEAQSIPKERIAKEIMKFANDIQKSKSVSCTRSILGFLKQFCMDCDYFLYCLDSEVHHSLFDE